MMGNSIGASVSIVGSRRSPPEAMSHTPHPYGSYSQRSSSSSSALHLGLSSSSVDLVTEYELQQRQAEEEVLRSRRKQRMNRWGFGTAIGVWTGAMIGLVLFALVRLLRPAPLDGLEGHLASGSAAELSAAAVTIEHALEGTEDPELAGGLALVEAHRFAAGASDGPTVGRAIDRAREQGADAQADVAQLIVAAIRDGAIDPAAVQEHQELLVHYQLEPWIEAKAALRNFEQDPALLTGPIEKLEAAQPTARRSRALAELYVRAGRVDEALTTLVVQTQTDPATPGPIVDLALYRSVTGVDEDEVQPVADAWLPREELLTPKDRARLLVARGIRRLRTGRIRDAQEDFEAARDAVPAWDLTTIDLGLEALVSAGLVDEARSWSDRADATGVNRTVFGAWLAFAQGDVSGARKLLEAVPSEHPRAAYLQALILLELEQWLDASAWLERARALMPGRPELEVAAARVRLRLGAVGEARARLVELSERYGWAPGVWTGLAESQALVRDEPKAVMANLRRALEREPRPARAAMLMAERVADPQRQLELYQRAVSDAPGVTGNRVALGLAQARLGRLSEAERTLEALADDPTVGPEGPLELSRIVLDRVRRRGDPLPPEAQEWLQLAARQGADTDALELETARLELAMNTSETLRSAVQRTRMLIDRDPKNIDARALHIEALGRSDRGLEAARTAKRWISRLPYRAEGPLYVAWAESAALQGHTRTAAKLAFRGYSKLAEAGASADRLLWAAHLTAEVWMALDQPGGARTVYRDLTDAAPSSPEAWAARAEIQEIAGFPDFACSSASKARALDPSIVLPEVLRDRCGSGSTDGPGS